MLQTVTMYSLYLSRFNGKDCFQVQSGNKPYKVAMLLSYY